VNVLVCRCDQLPSVEAVDTAGTEAGLGDKAGQGGGVIVAFGEAGVGSLPQVALLMEGNDAQVGECVRLGVQCFAEPQEGGVAAVDDVLGSETVVGKQ